MCVPCCNCRVSDRTRGVMFLLRRRGASHSVLGWCVRCVLVHHVTSPAGRAAGTPHTSGLPLPCLVGSAAAASHCPPHVSPLLECVCVCWTQQIGCWASLQPGGHAVQCIPSQSICVFLMALASRAATGLATAATNASAGRGLLSWCTGTCRQAAAACPACSQLCLATSQAVGH